jgi:hypothetical protein
MPEPHERTHQFSAEPGNANALDAFVGLHLHREEFAQHPGHVGCADQRLFQRQTDEIYFDLRNSHLVLRLTRRSVCPE